ncbi:hypothetical protein HMPREF0972_00452 [Actinomyces sp. oral taxon 848 str. F0332]|nr:hypothetical protein HMPREF0972_00452 [Actinomyces sp. oral taxon 848 str. F0332]
MLVFEFQLSVQRLRHRRRTSIALIALINTTPPTTQAILRPTARISSRDVLNEHSTFGGHNATLHTSSMPISLRRIGRRRKWREAGD